MAIEPWNKITKGTMQRFSDTSQFNLFRAIDHTGEHCLVYQLVDFPNPVPQLPKIRDLELTFRFIDTKPSFEIRLKNKSEADLFENVCLDLFGQVELASNERDGLSRLIQRTNRWQRWWRKRRQGGLTESEQQGLVGELYFLRELATALTPALAIEAWKGPAKDGSGRGEPKDFELLGSAIEVKTKRAISNNYVRISSLEQLADVASYDIYLRVIDILSGNKLSAPTLHEHVQLTEDLFKEDADALSIWQQKIDASGYEVDEDYGDTRWQITSSTDYKVIDDFPRIVPPVLPGVIEVKYSVNINDCEPYKLTTSIVEILRSIDG